jgi:hypothetical protein
MLFLRSPLLLFLVLAFGLASCSQAPPVQESTVIAGTTGELNLDYAVPSAWQKTPLEDRVEVWKSSTDEVLRVQVHSEPLPDRLKHLVRQGKKRYEEYETRPVTLQEWEQFHQQALELKGEAEANQGELKDEALAQCEHLLTALGTEHSTDSKAQFERYADLRNLVAEMVHYNWTEEAWAQWLSSGRSPLNEVVVLHIHGFESAQESGQSLLYLPLGEDMVEFKLSSSGYSLEELKASLQFQADKKKD